MGPGPLAGARRLLAVRLDNIGDVVMLGPALRAIRAGLPEATVALLASPAGSTAAPLLPEVDEVLTERVLWQDVSGALPLDPARELALAGRLRAGRFDGALIFTSFSQSPHPPALACYLAGIPVRIGQSREFAGGVLTAAVRPPPDRVHQVDRNLHLVEAAGLPPAGRDLALRIPEEARVGADALLGGIGIGPGDPFLLVVPGASCPARRYDPDRFGSAAAGLARAAGLPAVLAGSAREAALGERVARAAGGAARSLVGRTTLPELAAIVGRASLVVANDSAAMHLADALRRPVVVLYSGTEGESQWRPRSAPARLLRRRTPCSPCHRFECPYGLPCLDIPPAAVVEAALDLLGRRGSPGMDIAERDDGQVNS